MQNGASMKRCNYMLIIVHNAAISNAVRLATVDLIRWVICTLPAIYDHGSKGVVDNAQ